MMEVRFAIEGNHVYLTFEFFTGVCGENMVTIATQAICNHISEHTPVQPQYSFVEANFSGDKKACVLSFQGVRGKKVVAEVTLSPELVKRSLHSTPEMMVKYWRMSAIGGVMSGTIGVQGHYANGLAALFIACGQDAACVAESSVGITRFELTEFGRPLRLRDPAQPDRGDRRRRHKFAEPAGVSGRFSVWAGRIMRRPLRKSVPRWRWRASRPLSPR